MLGWAIGFFVISAISAIFGFSGITSNSAETAQDLFYVFIALFMISFLMHSANNNNKEDGYSDGANTLDRNNKDMF